MEKRWRFSCSRELLTTSTTTMSRWRRQTAPLLENIRHGLGVGRLLHHHNLLPLLLRTARGRQRGWYLVDGLPLLRSRLFARQWTGWLIAGCFLLGVHEDRDGAGIMAKPGDTLTDTLVFIQPELLWDGWPCHRLPLGRGAGGTCLWPR